MCKTEVQNIILAYHWSLLNFGDDTDYHTCKNLDSYEQLLNFSFQHITDSYEGDLKPVSPK